MMWVRASPRKSCRVCRLPPSEVDLVEGGTLSGWSPRSIAARFTGITRRDVAGHMARCVSQREEQDD